MKKRRRLRQCLNCKTQLNISDNYCPNCGQENHAKTFALRELWDDFIGSLFNFDGKIFQTLRMIFTRPGKVPKDILAGKKVRYVPTIRFYFFVSFIYFLILNFGVDLMMKSDEARDVLAKFFDKKLERSIPIDKPTYLLYRDSSEVALQTLASKILDTSDIKFINKNKLLSGQGKSMYDSIVLKKKENANLKKENFDLGVVKFDQSTSTSNDYRLVFAMKPAYDSIYVNGNKISYQDMKEIYYNRDKIEHYVSTTGRISNVLKRAVVKSTTELMAIIKFGNITEKRDYIRNFLKKNLSNFSLALLLIMPMSALILYPFYYYKRRKLMTHILFTVHLHSVMLILLSIIFAGITSQYVLGFMLNRVAKDLIILAILTYSSVYFIFALKRFYESSWRSAILKSFFINSIYMALLISITIGVFVISMI